MEPVHDEPKSTIPQTTRKQTLKRSLSTLGEGTNSSEDPIPVEMGKRKRRKKKKVKDVSFAGRMDRATTRALKRMTAKTDKPEDLARHPLEKQSLKRMHEGG